MTPADHLEALALHAALWGDPFATLDMIDDGTLDPDLFTDPGHRATVAAIVALVTEAQELPEPATVAAYLIEHGMALADARASVILAGTFEAADCRSSGLVHYLHKLAEDRDRRALEGRLLHLANALPTPGGPARVAAALGVVA